jgi:hypothetical protein
MMSIVAVQTFVFIYTQKYIVKLTWLDFSTGIDGISVKQREKLDLILRVESSFLQQKDMGDRFGYQ